VNGLIWANMADKRRCNSEVSILASVLDLEDIAASPTFISKLVQRCVNILLPQDSR